MISLTFKPKAVGKRLLSVLPDRARVVIEKRYGLGTDPQRSTLESIGESYGITRERVRQIENYAIGLIRKSDAYEKEKAAFEELMRAVHSMGGIVSEEQFLNHVSKDPSTRNHIHLMLTIGTAFTRLKEDDDFHHRWHVNDDIANSVHKSLRTLYESLSDDELIPEGEFISKFLLQIEGLNEQYKNEEVAKRWLGLSKKVGRNPLGEWGKAESSSVRVKGMRDYAYLVLKRHGSPMHFREVAKAITTLFNRRAHEATCHNELIKDKRFVLVGRGLYALREWGYATGVVKDVIRQVLKTNGPLTREEIIDKVKKERYVKDNTIIVNLQDNKSFKRNSDGTYVAA